VLAAHNVCECIEPGGMMTDQTRRATRVRIPGQGGSADRSSSVDGATDATEQYRPRHRADPGETLPEPTVVPPSGQLASRRRAAAAPARAASNAALRAPAPLVPHQVKRVYETPGWVPTPHPDEQDESQPVLVEDGAEILTRPEGMIRHARWTSARHANAAATLLLIGFLAVAAAAGSGLLRRQSTPALALSRGCLLGAAGLYALLVVLRPVVVVLDEPYLTVRRGDHHDRFDLASPHLRARVSGRPGSRRWLLLLDCPDGRVVRVRHRMVDSRRLDVVVGYGQAVAARERTAREIRFAR